MIFLKRGVKLLGPNGLQLHPLWHEHALDDIENTFLQYNSPCVITSAFDGKHMDLSLHYEGRGLDFRTRTVRKSMRKPLTSAVQDILGMDWDAVFEGDHLHVEYDPI